MPSLHPSNTLKLTAFFAIQPGGQYQQGGWSNTYWMTGSDLGVGLPMLAGLVNDYMAAVCQDIGFQGGRVVQANVPHKVLELDYNDTLITASQGTFTAVTPPAAPTKSLHPELAVMLRLKAADGSTGYRYFHGIPFSAYTPEEGLDLVSGSWPSKLTTYLSNVKSNTLLVSGPAPGTPKPISSDIKPVGIRERRIGRPAKVFRGSRPVR